MAEHEKEHGGHEGGGGSHGGGSHGGGGHGAGGGSHEEAHEGAPEWLISFADNVALMMGFFVILLAMNMGPKATPIQGGAPEDDENGEATAARAADIVISIREAFNNKVDPFGDSPDEAWLRKRMRDRFEGSTNQPGPQGDHPNLQAIRPTDYNRVTARVPFDDGSATLTADGREVIASAAVGLRDQRWIVDVRGHVSPFEAMRNVRAARLLAYDRAYAVAEVLVQNGVAWENIRVSSLGEIDRVVARTYDRDKDRANQRVEIVQTDEPLPEDPYSKTPEGE